MSKLVKVLLDGTFKSGLILSGRGPAPAGAHDSLGAEHAEALRKPSHLELTKSVNYVPEDEIELWRNRAADAGLVIVRSSDVYTITDARDAPPAAAADTAPSDVHRHANRKVVVQ